MTHFAASGLDVPFWLPAAAALVVSFFSSMVGLSGAVLLLPFQMNVLGFTSPAVSPTNLVFNIVAVPGGVWGFARERRLLWPLAWILVAGTIPGMLLGIVIRFRWLPSPEDFQIFAGALLLFIALNLLWGARLVQESDAACGGAADGRWEGKRLLVACGGRHCVCSVPRLMALGLGVGLVGGIYGIGGGAIIAPFLVAFFRLPLQAVSGASLACTLITSVAGAGFSQSIAGWFRGGGMPVAPDWLLGAMFGVGGALGAYLGARTQKYVPGYWLRLLLAGLLAGVAAVYLSAAIVR